MKAKIVATLIEEVYYNGRVNEGSRKLEYDDFLNLAAAAYGTVMRNVYWQMRQADPGSELLFFGDNLEEKEFPVLVKDPNQRYITLGETLIGVPFGLGILEIVPTASGEGCIQPFVKAQPGAEYLYCDVDFNVPFYVRKGKNIYLFGNKCVKKGDNVTMSFINFTEDMDIQQDVVWDVMNQVLGVVLKVQGFPIDPSNDHNPNVTAMKEKISVAEAGN